jgi:hypothetical protein
MAADHPPQITSRRRAAAGSNQTIDMNEAGAAGVVAGCGQQAGRAA